MYCLHVWEVLVDVERWWAETLKSYNRDVQKLRGHREMAANHHPELSDSDRTMLVGDLDRFIAEALVRLATAHELSLRWRDEVHG